MEKLFINMIDKSECAVIFFRRVGESVFYANKQALKLYGTEEGVIDIDKVLGTDTLSTSFRDTIVKDLKEKEVSTIYDVSTVMQTGEYKLCDFQVGFADEEKETIFMNMRFKEDKRMDIAYSQVNQSTRAEGILNFDEKLSLIHCNSLFHQVFESDEQLRHSHYGNDFSNGFQPDIREELLRDIQENLKKAPTYFTKMKVITSKGVTTWYSLELQRRTLDDSGVDKIMAYMVNIENLVEMEQEFRSINRHFDALQDLSEDMLFRIDIHNKKLIRRRDQADIFGTGERIVDFPQAVFQQNSVHPDDLYIYEAFAERALAGEGGMAEVRMRERNQENYEFRRIIWTTVANEEGKISEVFGKLTNIHTMRELEKKAQFDALTNLLNKRAMLEESSAILHGSGKGGLHALFFLDLDDFKYVNDHFGHRFGDFLLQELGKRLDANTRSGDLVGRVGGDEFVVFVRGIPSVEILMGKAKLLLSTISEEFSDGTNTHVIHGSIGIAVYPEHGQTYEELYHHADIALYQSKRKGKNEATLYSE